MDTLACEERAPAIVIQRSCYDTVGDILDQVSCPGSLSVSLGVFLMLAIFNHLCVTLARCRMQGINIGDEATKRYLEKESFEDASSDGYVNRVSGKNRSCIDLELRKMRRIR